MLQTGLIGKYSTERFADAPKRRLLEESQDGANVDSSRVIALPASCAGSYRIQVPHGTRPLFQLESILRKKLCTDCGCNYILLLITIIIKILKRGSVVKVTRDQAAANREALLEAAGRLIRQRGVDGVGVAELCRAAGMTHGALYSRFGSKDDLAAEALTQGQSASLNRMMAAIGDAPGLAAIVDFYVSTRHRDNFSTCCPMVASASEAARQSGSFRASFANAFCNLSGLIHAALEKHDTTKPDDVSMVVAASMIGVVAVARALKTPDPAMSDALINASRAMLENFAAIPTTSTGGRKKQPKRPRERPGAVTGAGRDRKR